MAEIKPGLGYVDRVVTKAITPTLPMWHALGATPNALTTLGLLTSGACVFALYRRSLVGALLCLVMRWYFDYADGLLARKYGQTSVVGDWYDHIVDVCFSAGIVGVFVCARYPTRVKVPLVGTLVVFFALFMVQMGCIERAYRATGGAAGREETSISRLRALCPPPGIGVRIIDAFDNGTLYIVMGVAIAVMCRQEAQAARG